MVHTLCIAIPRSFIQEVLLKILTEILKENKTFAIVSYRMATVVNEEILTSQEVFFFFLQGACIINYHISLE